MLKKILLICLVSVFAFGDAAVVLPDGWAKPEGYAYTLSMTARVVGPDGNDYIETTGSTLAAFGADGSCRGVVAGKAASSGVFIYRLSVSSNAASESGITLKILDARTGEVYDIRETIVFHTNDIIGSTGSPYILHAKPFTQELAIPLVQNWNWISFNVDQGERSLDEFLADYVQNATDDDIIKSSSDFATFFDGHWDPEDFRIEPGKMYLLRKQKAGACTMTVEGAPLTGQEEIPLVAGWNWLGYTGAAPATLNAMFHFTGFQDDDIIKSSTDFATFFDGLWDGDVNLVPGRGYLLRQNAAGKMDFRNAEANPAE
jgi:hypothetical protein